MRSFLALIRKDLKGYFDQPTGYILIVVFVALLSWSFFRSAFITSEASLRPLFTTDFAVESPSIPWLLALLVPAATMRLLAEEQRDGTLEILLTQPIKGWVILFSKFVSGLIFVTVAILSTVGIPIAISTAGSLDWGAIVAQYAGSIFLAGSFVAIGLFTSSLTRNQIVAFIIGLFVTLVLMLLGLEQVGVTFPVQLAVLLQSVSPLTHFSSMARGVIDLRDILYFIAIVSTFLSATFLSIRGKTLSHRSPQYRNLQLGTVALIVLSLLVGWFGNTVQGRLDLTADNIFTLSSGTEEIISDLDDLLTIELYQSQEPPVDIAIATRDISDFLEDLASRSGSNVKLIHRFPDSDEDDARKAALAGVQPQQFNIVTPNGLEIKSGFLGMTMTYTDRRETIRFLGDSIDGFEYRMATIAFNMTQRDVDRKSIGFLTGHGEKDLRTELASLGSILSQQYALSEVSDVDDSPLNLDGIDVLIIPGPTQRMSEDVYQTIEAYINNGGKVMALVDSVTIDEQRLVAIPNQFHFGDFVERYGVLVEDNLVFDVRSNETLSFGTSLGNVLLPYPYWARVGTVDRKVAGEVESALFPWASSIGVADLSDSGVDVIPILRTSPFAAVDYNYGDVTPNSPQLDVTDRQTFESDIGVALESRENSGTDGAFRLVVIGDSDWLADSLVARADANLALGLNLIDWLAQEDTLAEIRSKVITSRSLIFNSPTHRSIVQYVNVALVPIAFIILGVFRYVRRRSITLRVFEGEK